MAEKRDVPQSIMPPTNPRLKLTRPLSEFKAGDHICAFYESAAECSAILTAFIRDGFERGDLCVCVLGGLPLGDAVRELQSAGIDTAAALVRGTLAFMSGAEYAGTSTAGSAAQLDAIAVRVRQLLASGGFRVARLAVDMSWALEVKFEPRQMIEYEALSGSRLFPLLPALMLCMYDRARIAPEVICAALRGHPIAMMGGRASANPYYQPPALATSAETDNARANWMIEQLRSASEQREELSRSEAGMRSLVEYVSDGVMALAPDGEILFERPPVDCQLGYQPQELIGRHVIELVHPDDAPATLAGFARLRDNPGVAQKLRLRIRRRDGSWIHVEASARMDGDDAAPWPIIFNWRDIGERLRVEQELADARDRALEASQIKSSFLAGMTHEIRTPLNVILGYTELIAEQVGGSDELGLAPSLDAIARAGKRLNATIQGVLDISRIESGALKLAPRRLILGPMIERQVRDFGMLANRKGLELSFINEEPGATAIFDEYCLTQALSNLLDNAIKFTDHGAITARLHRKTGGRLALEVADTGAGIDPAYLPQLFEPFTQESASHRHLSQGAGLGLALTRRYVEFNGAELSVTSVKGGGATFTIRFSHADGSASVAAEDDRGAHEAAAVHDGPRRCVMVIEDDPDTQAYMKAALGKRYEVAVAGSAAEVRREFEARRGHVDLLLMDLGLGGACDGLTLTRELRADVHWRMIPIIALTARATSEDQQQALAAGCDEYLAKPVERRRLLAVIDSLLPR
ncbi:MAG: MEDS domain-containing protein [Candidatus Binataceae bacterium]